MSLRSSVLFAATFWQFAPLCRVPASFDAPVGSLMSRSGNLGSCWRRRKLPKLVQQMEAFLESSEDPTQYLVAKALGAFLAGKYSS